MVGIELQLTKDKATIVGGNVSIQRLIGLEVQLTAYSADVEDLRLDTHRSAALERSGYFFHQPREKFIHQSIETTLQESAASSDTPSHANSQLILTPPSTSPRFESPLSGSSPLTQRQKEQV